MTAAEPARAARRLAPARRPGWSCAALLLPAVVAGCGPPEGPEPVILRAGDTLFDHLPVVEVVEWSAGNLPGELAALAEGESVRMALPPIPRESWGLVRNIPADWEPLLETVGEYRLWRTPLPGPLVAEGDPDPSPTIRINTRPPPEWVPGEGPPPATVAWWDADTKALLALSVESPVVVAVERDVPVAEAFLGLEGPTRPAAPRVERTAFGRVVRPALWAPAPARLRFGFDGLQAERLEFVVGRRDVGWVAEDGVLEETTEQGDGVRFAVEARRRPEPPVEGRPAPPEVPFVRVWEGDLDAAPQEVVLEGVADLTPWLGQPVELQLVTEARGDAVADYAAWTGLRLRGGVVRPSERPHVVLLDIDTLRADRLGVYGNPDGLTPRLDAWAADAVVYADALAPASWTLPSTVSMFTGLAVHQHGIGRGVQALGEQVPTLAARLRAAGYETRGLNAGGYLRPSFGLDAGFDVYETTADPKDLDWSGVLDDVAEHDSERPLFLMLHTYFVHAPYEHDPALAADYDGRFAGQDVDYPNVFDPFRRGELELSEADAAYVEAMYDGLVAALDAYLGDFLDALDVALAGQPALVILTSDHGEAFLEHDLLGHGEALWAELLRVPLMVRYPDGRAGRSDRPAALVDLVPTVLDVVGLPIPEGLAGQSLALPAPGGPPRVRVASLDDGQHATHSDGWSLLEFVGDDPAPVRLFELRDDPTQTRDLAGERSDLVDDMGRRRTWFEVTFPAVEAAADTAGGLSEADKAQLRALGYLGDDD